MGLYIKSGKLFDTKYFIKNKKINSSSIEYTSRSKASFYLFCFFAQQVAKGG